MCDGASLCDGENASGSVPWEFQSAKAPGLKGHGPKCTCQTRETQNRVVMLSVSQSVAPSTFHGTGELVGDSSKTSPPSEKRATKSCS